MALRAMNSPQWLLANGSATGVAHEWAGGAGAFFSEHTGGTVSLEYNSPNPAGATWTAVGPDTTLAATGGGMFFLPPGTRIRASVAGATSVYCYVHQIQDPANQ